MSGNAFGIYAGGRKHKVVPSLKNYWLDASDTSTLLNTSNAAISDGQVVGKWKDKNGSGVDCVPIDPSYSPQYSSSGGGSIVFSNQGILHCKYDDGAPNWMGNSLYCVLSSNTTSQPVTNVISKFGSAKPYSTIVAAYTFFTSHCYSVPMITPAGDYVPLNRMSMDASTVTIKRYIAIVTTVGIDTSTLNAYYGPNAIPSGSMPNTSQPVILPAGTGWDPSKIDVLNTFDFILGGQGDTKGKATAQSSSAAWSGSIHELRLYEGADDYATVQNKMQALHTKWGN